MSAIAAFYNLRNKAVDPLLLERISKKLEHRGTNDCGVLSNGTIGLVHRMRWTTPESLEEKLPAKSPRAPLFITCDARLDNRAELLSKLSIDGLPEEISDSRIILEAYEKWGEKCLPHLIGDFVIAIWDSREQKLFAARDPLGVKHFYYYYAPDGFFVLASEIKALFAVEEIERRLDERRLVDYLALNSEDKESTFFRNIKRLPATSALTVSEKGLRVWQYWQPGTDEIKLKNEAEYQEAFREKLTEAVHARLRSAYPVGAFLSGGLDSSAIVCIAAEHLRGEGKPPLKTFSAVFPTVAETDPRIDETVYMRSVIEKTGCDADFVKVDDDDPLRDMREIFWHADDPVGAPNVYMDWEIYRAAREKGVRVLLSGTDGDSTVSHGYEDFARLAYSGMYLRLLRDAVALSRNMPRRSHSIKRSVWHRGIKKAAPASIVNAWRAVRRRKPGDYEPSPVRFPLNYRAVKPDLKERFDLENRIAAQQRKNYPADSPPAELHWRGLTSGHFSFMLEQFEKLSAAFGIEGRYPFFDRRLIEFCIALPPGQRIYKGWTRSIFRFAMEGVLPADVQWRTDKSDIGAGIKTNLLKYGYKKLEEAINLNSEVLEDYIDTDLLQEAFRKYKADPLNSEPETLLILSNVYLSNWLRFAKFA